MKEPLIGRKKEKKILWQYYNSKTSELVAIYGRRRVGKTYLVKTEFASYFDFYFTGVYKGAFSTQLNGFFIELQNRSDGMFDTVPKTWMQAFDMLNKYLNSLKKDKVLVFIDELPWIDTPRSNFINSFSYFYNTWLSTNSILKLFVCGSQTTWMINKMIGDKGGLYGRTTRSIYLAPFTLEETKQYLNEIKKCNYTSEQVLDVYMYVGGIPYYLSMFDNTISIIENIDDLFFKRYGSLKTEFDFVFRSLFNESESYKKVIFSLSKKNCGITRDEISKETGISGGTLTKILSDLELCDFLRTYNEFDKKSREKIYQLVDMYSLFYLKLVEKSPSDENYWSNVYNKPIYNTWKGYAFEIAILNNISIIKKALGINGIITNVCSWKKNGYTDDDGVAWKGGQIDLLIEREDKVINVAEIKYSSEEYIITKEYSEIIKNRIENFRHYTKTKKALRSTFITLNGLKEGKYNYIVQDDIKLIDLL